MFKLFKNKKAQNTAEYAILIALVIGGVVAMQTYAQRTLQGRIRDASVTFKNSTNPVGQGGLGDTLQYEPYYTNTVSGIENTKTDQDTYYDQTRNAYSTTNAAGYRDRTEYSGETGY